MLGLIVLASERGSGLPPEGLFEPFLGVPLLARGIIGAVPADEAVTGVLVVPPAFVERAKTEVVDRFGLAEVEQVVAGGPDRRAALLAGLNALPADVELVLVQEAARVLVATGLVDRVVRAARMADGAVPAVPTRDVWVAEADGSLRVLRAPAQLRCVQGPACFRVAQLRAALLNDAGGDTHEVEVLGSSGASLRLVDGDEDNRLLRDAADVGRALEVFTRRAVDFAFLYPKDLLPDDPLARALDAVRDSRRAGTGEPAADGPGDETAAG